MLGGMRRALTRRDAMRPFSLLDVDDLVGERAPKAKGFAQ